MEPRLLPHACMRGYLMHMRKRLTAILAASLCATPALAAWEAIYGGASDVPAETNSNIERILVHCVEGPVLAVYIMGGGTIQPKGGGEVNDYFYKPGFISAVVDDRDFPLVAAGSDDAVVLFSEGSLAENYLAPLHPDLVAALSAGKKLTLAFDLTAANAADGSAFETTATFPLDGAAAVIAKALEPCQ